MVQFCPKCGTQAPDDEAVFCNRCGTRLPPVIPEKKEIFCPLCGTKALDDQSVFCNKCGSPFQAVAPVQARQNVPPAAPPKKKKPSCPSCGAPLVDEISEFCNLCGASTRSPAPAPAPAPAPPLAGTFHEPALHAGIPEPDPLGPGKTDTRKTDPEPKKNSRPLLKYGIVAVAVIILLAVAAAFVTGMIPGMNLSSSNASVSATDDQTPVTTLPTAKPTKTKTPTATPTKIKTTTVPATGGKTNTSTKLPANVSATMTSNATVKTTSNVSANATANASVTVKKTLAVSNLSKPFAIGESATDGKVKLTVNGYTMKDKLSDPIPSYAVGKKYLIVDLTMENLQNETAEPNISGMYLKDGGGYSFDQTIDVLLENPFYVLGKTIPPQEKKTGNMVFIVPPGSTYLTFQYDFGNQNIATFQLS